MNIFDDMRTAVRNAQTTLRAADAVADEMARLLRGRLKSVEDTQCLKDLKRELTKFDSHTGKWKEGK